MTPKLSAQKNMSPSTGATIGYEAELWRIADALRGSMDAAEYKNVVPGSSFEQANAYAKGNGGLIVLRPAGNSKIWSGQHFGIGFRYER